MQCHFTYCIVILHITLQIEYCYPCVSIDSKNTVCGFEEHLI